jgi:uncharacterized protein YybS (DUF2232 family)
MRNSKTEKLVKASILTSAIVVLALAGFYLPFVGIITVVAAPIVTAMIYKTSGKGFTVISFFSTLFILGMMIDPISALSQTIVFYSTGIGLMFMLSHDISPLVEILVIAFFIAIGYVAMVGIDLAFITNMSLTEMVDMNIKVLQESMREAVKMYEGMGADYANEQSVKDIMALTVDQVMIMIPASLAMYSLVSAYILRKVSERVFKPFGITLSKLPSFDSIKPNMILISATLFLSIIGISMMYFEIPAGSSVMYFGKTMFDITAGIGGLSLITYYMNRKLKFNKFTKFMAIFLILTTPILTYTMMIAGVIDSAFDFRNTREDGLFSILRRKLKGTGK